MCPECGVPMHLVNPGQRMMPHFRLSARQTHDPLCPQRNEEKLVASFDRDDEEALTAKANLERATSWVTLAVIEEFWRHPQRLKTMNRHEFEEFVAGLFKGFGYEVEMTKKTRDGGYDFMAVSHRDFIRQKFLVECKRPDPGNPVRLDVVKQLYATKHEHGANKAILVTTTHFTRDAVSYGAKHAVELDLKDFDDLVMWLRHYVTMNGR